MVIMQKKSITFLIMTVFTSLFLVGCHGEETIDNLKSTIETVGKFADSLAQINDEASESRSSDSVTGYANAESDDESAKTSSESIGILTKASDIELTDVDGKGKNYVFHSFLGSRGITDITPADEKTSAGVPFTDIAEKIISLRYI